MVNIRILNRGSLTSLGYHIDSPASERHRFLREAVRIYGKTDLIRKLNAVSVLNRNRNPRASRIFHQDMLYVQGL
jgi:hypothetical protein